MSKQPGGFMGIKSTTKSTTDVINEQIAKNDIIIEQRKEIGYLQDEMTNVLEKLELLFQAFTKL